MLYLVNPRRKRTTRKRTRKATKRKAGGRRPTAKQLAARRKFVAMARARAKAAKSRKRAHSGGGKMAARRRKRATARKRVTRRRSPVTTLRRRSVYQTNPRRRRRRPTRTRRRYRRNPPSGGRGILGQTINLAQDSAAALVGAGISRTVGGMIPIGGNPLLEFAKGAGIAVALKVFGRKAIGDRFAGMAAVGAMMDATRNVVVAYVPAAEQFLGRSDGVMYLPPTVPSLRAYVGDEYGTTFPIGTEDEDDVGLSAYSDSMM